MRVVSIPASRATYSAGRGGRSPRYVVVHNTGGRGLAGGETAEANGRYFAGGNRGASAHWFVDGSGDVVASVPEGDTAWHAGNFAFNQLSVGIEVVSDGSPFTEGEIRDLRELVQDVRARWSIPPENVIRHYDCRDFGDRDGVGGSWVDPWKSCPEAYVDHARWHREVWSRVAPDGSPEPRPDPAEPSRGRIDEDGWWGRETTRALQALFGLEQTGTVEHQWPGSVDAHPGLTYGWLRDTTMEGSPVVRALQEHVGMAGEDADGLFGRRTATFLQAHVGTVRDGVIDGPSPCVREMQRRLNEGTF